MSNLDISKNKSEKNISHEELTDVNSSSLSFNSYLDRSINKNIIPKNIDAKIIPRGFRWQSFTYAFPYTIITAYDKNKKNNSRLYFYDNRGNNIGYVVLNSKSHVGGIAYDIENEILYVTGNRGRIEAYNYKKIKDIISKRVSSNHCERLCSLNNTFNYSSHSTVLNINKNLFDSNDNRLSTYNAATTCYKDGKLFVATFSDKTKILEYDVLNNNGNLKISFSRLVADNLGPAVQGIAVYEDTLGDKFVLITQSYGIIDSCIIKYKISSDGCYEFVGEKVLKGRPGIEGIVVDSVGKIYCNFENIRFRKNNSNKIYCLNIDEVCDSESNASFLKRQRALERAAARYRRHR